MATQATQTRPLSAYGMTVPLERGHKRGALAQRAGFARERPPSAGRAAKEQNTRARRLRNVTILDWGDTHLEIAPPHVLYTIIRDCETGWLRGNEGSMAGQPAAARMCSPLLVLPV